MSRKFYIECSCLHEQHTGIARTISTLIKTMEECDIEVVKLEYAPNMGALRTFLYYTYTLPNLCKKRMKEDDIFLIPNNMGKFWRLPFKNTWVLMHDLIPLTPYGQYSPIKRFLYSFKTKQIRKASKVITISEYIKKSIIDHFNVEPEKVKVLYWGAFTASNTKSVSVELEPYFLSIGTGEYRKKVDFLIKNWSHIYQNKYKLKLFGKEWKTGAHEELRQLIENACMKDYIEVLGPISDEEMNNLYSHSYGLIFPSMEEGFGLPPIEALCCGSNVILPKTPINYELYAGICKFYSLGDVEELAACIQEIVCQGTSNREKNMAFCCRFSLEVFKNRVNKIFNSDNQYEKNSD